MIPSADTILSRFVVRAKFRHMQVLVKLTELGSMRRAADAINMTQPAISQQVAELEKLIGAELFFRHAKGVAPTDVAKELLPVARQVLSALQDGSESIAHRLRSNSGVVKVAASPAAIGGLLLNTLGPFSDMYPDIQVRVIENAETGAVDGPISNAADIVCTRRPEIIPEGWQFVSCLEDRLIVVCGAGHPLVGRAELTAKELGRFRWLMNRVGSVARRRFEDAFQTYEWTEEARGSLVFHIPELTRELLTTQDFLAILPQSVAQPWLSAGTVCALKTPLTDDLPPLGVLHPQQGQGRAIEKFVEFLRRDCSGVSPGSSM